MKQSIFAGAAATLIGSAIWGLIWLPLQVLENAGLSNFWATAFIQIAALVSAVMVVGFYKELNQLNNLDNWLIGFCMGSSTMLYFMGILFSDVVRVIFLFYSLPAWAILWNVLFYGVKPIPRHYLVIAIAMFGLWLLLSGGESWIPAPQNMGDWCGLMAGSMWGLGLVLLQHRKTPTPRTTSLCAFVFSVALTLIAMALVDDAPFGSLTMASLTMGLPTAVLVGIAVQLPLMVFVVWGAQRLQAATAALLTMAEILTATVSFSLLVGNPLNAIAWTGGAIIVLAGVVDIVGDTRTVRA